MVQQAGWFSDPTSRWEYRFWDGSTWTSRVASGGVEQIDPLPATGGATDVLPATASGDPTEGSPGFASGVSSAPGGGPAAVGDIDGATQPYVVPLATAGGEGAAAGTSGVLARTWRGFRRLPLVVQLLAGFFTLGLVAAPFVGSSDDEDVAVAAAKSSSTTMFITSVATTTTARPAATTAPTTTVPVTTTAAPTTTAPSSTVRPTTTAAPTTAAPATSRVTAADPGAAPCATGQVKGNNNSGIFHAPGQRDYAKTTANVTCFNTEAEAVAAGFRKAQR